MIDKIDWTELNEYICDLSIRNIRNETRKNNFQTTELIGDEIDGEKIDCLPALTQWIANKHLKLSPP